MLECILSLSFLSFASASSGIVSEEKEYKNEAGKNIIGRAIPVRIPYEAMAPASSEPLFLKLLGIKICSRATSDERKKDEKETGRVMLSTREVKGSFLLFRCPFIFERVLLHNMAARRKEKTSALTLPIITALRHFIPEDEVLEIMA